MNKEEFKAWFEGFSEGVDLRPTEKQWKRIKDKVKEIDGSSVTERIFIDRYRNYWPQYQPYWYGHTMGAESSNKFSCGLSAAVTGSNTHKAFNSAEALYAVGKLEAVI